MYPDTVTRISNRKGERGNVLAYTVMSAFFLFMAVGLCVDLSHLYLAKTELQNSADAAALAAASALTLPLTDPADPTKAYRIPQAVNRALQLLNSNNYNFNNRNFATSDRSRVRFAVNLSEFDDGGSGGVNEAGAIANPTNIRFIKVTTPSVAINTFFAIPILGLSKNLDARAVSGMSVPGNLSVFCTAPLAAVSCTPNDPNCSLCDPSDPLYPNCTASKYWGVCPGTDPYALQDTTRNGPDDPDGDGKCDPKKEFCKRCNYNIRSGAQNGQGPSAGNFQVLRCAGAGANEVKQALAEYGTDCNCGALSPGGTVDTQTGELAGAVRAGLNVRFDDYGNGLTYGATMPPDSNIEQGASHGNGNNQYWDGISYNQYNGTSNPPVTPRLPVAEHRDLMKANRRTLTIPIIPITEFSNGNSTVHVSRMAGFFMRASVSDGTGGDIQVEYISDDIIGVIGFDPNNINNLNIVTPVLYR